MGGGAKTPSIPDTGGICFLQARQEGETISITWEDQGQFDYHNIRWWTEGGDVIQEGSKSPWHTIWNVRPGTRYYAAVEGCISHFLGHSTCTDWYQTSIDTTSLICDGGAGVYVYEHINYQGQCAKFTMDSSTPDWWPIGNDTASSIYFVGCWTATLYAAANYEGAGTRWIRAQDGGTSRLEQTNVGNDTASSIQVIPC